MPVTISPIISGEIEKRLTGSTKNGRLPAHGLLIAGASNYSERYQLDKIFYISLRIALGFFAVGLAYRVIRWFALSIETPVGQQGGAIRAKKALRGIAGAVFSRKVRTLSKTLIVDVFFQKRLLSVSPYRWFSHQLVFLGFLLLFFMHALESLVMKPLVADYASTQNPYLFLRNLAALAILVGILMSFRGKKNLPIKIERNRADKLLLLLLCVLLVSGIFLEGLKITSASKFKEMVEEYTFEDDPGALNALEYYWTKSYGLVSSQSFDGNARVLLKKGRELHEVSCLSCHSKPQWAFLSYAVSRGIKPVAIELDTMGGTSIARFLHFMVAFFALALFPYTKLFHIVASPLSLLANATMAEDSSDPANIATRQMIELDACTHCGICSEICALQAVSRIIPNINIYPSEKIQRLKTLIGESGLPEKELSKLLEGLYLCTNCYRCTEVCPVGINIQALWFSAREAALEKAPPEPLVLTPFSFARGLKAEIVEKEGFQANVDRVKRATEISGDAVRLTDVESVFLYSNSTNKKAESTPWVRGTFSGCFSCTSCSSVCPVVWAVEDPKRELGLVPHQVIRAMNFGAIHLVFRSEMLWSCVGCYMCQEACPQGVRVADIFAELRMVATDRVRDNPSRSERHQE